MNNHIKPLAQWLELYPYPNPEDPSQIDYFFFINDQPLSVHKGSTGTTVILFAAYVKAELAKRGWHWEVVAKQWYFENDMLSKGTSLYPANVFNQADIMSEVEAILAAANEIREMES